MGFETGRRYATKADAIRAIIDDPQIAAKSTTAAEQYLRDHIPLEKHYQAKVKDKIKELYPDCFIFKATQGSYSQSGIPDLIAIIKGQFWGFEIKRPYFGKATGVQMKTLEAIRRAGGHAHIVSYPDEAEEILRAWEEGRTNEEP